jgi:hypothetical protein
MYAICMWAERRATRRPQELQKGGCLSTKQCAQFRQPATLLQSSFASLNLYSLLDSIHSCPSALHSPPSCGALPLKSSMALRRSIGGLSAVLNSLRQLTLPEASSAACSHHHLAAPTLVSLRSFWLASGSPACPPSAAAAPVLASGCRQFSSAAPSRQQAAAAAAAAPPAAAAGEQEETLEQIRARIFGTHIGGMGEAALCPASVHLVCG